MKSIAKQTIFILFLIISQQAIAQQSSSTRYFKEIGWTLQVPADFTVLDSATVAANAAAGKAALEQSSDTKIDVGNVKTFISAVKGPTNNFSANYSYSAAITADNYDSADLASKTLLLNTFTKLIPSTSVDTATTVKTISGLSFRSFGATFTMEGNMSLHVVYISRRIKEHPFSFFYFYTDAEAGKRLKPCWLLRNLTSNILLNNPV